MDDVTVANWLRTADEKHVLRRELLKAAGVGVSATVVGAGTASASGHYDGPTRRSYEAATVDPADIDTFDGGGDSPDGDEGEGEEVDRTIPKQAPETSGDAGSGAGPVQESAPEGGLVETDFDGLSALDVRGVVPSDAQIAAGPDDLVEAINSQVAFFTKSGEQTFQASLDAFFAPATPFIDEEAPGEGFFQSYIIFDPRARYDPDSGRFIVACVDFSLETALGAMLVAVSSTSDPSDPWSLYRIPPLAQQGGDPTRGLVDYPELGYDDEAIYLTQNFFPGSFAQATMVALDKADATSGETVDATHFTDLRNPDGSLAFTIQPADGGGYFANSTYFQGQTLTLWSIDDPLGEPTLTNTAVPVDPYSNPPEGADQPDTEEKIDMGDDRILRVSYDGSSVWASHTVNDGRARWYELTEEGSVVQSGSFHEGGEKTFLPAITSDGESAVFVYNRVTPSGDGTGYVDLGVAAVADGRVTRHETVKGGENDYDYVDPDEDDAGTQTLRWGDYNGAVPDPSGGFWVVGQYAKQVDLGVPEHIEDNFYGTRITRIDP